jgi:hypothetical protein
MFKIAKITNLAVGVFLLFATVSTAYATESSGVGGKPANPRDDNPRTQSIFVHEISPGSSVDDAILVSNSSGSKKISHYIQLMLRFLAEVLLLVNKKPTV